MFSQSIQCSLALPWLGQLSAHSARCDSAPAEATAQHSEPQPAAAAADQAADPPSIDARKAAALIDAAAVLPSRADILVTDAFDHR